VRRPKPLSFAVWEHSQRTGGLALSKFRLAGRPKSLQIAPRGASVSSECFSGSDVCWYSLARPGWLYAQLPRPRVALSVVACAAALAAALTLAHEAGSRYRDSVLRERQLGDEAHASPASTTGNLRSTHEAVQSAFAALAEFEARYTQAGPFSDWTDRLAFIPTLPPPVREARGGTSENQILESGSSGPPLPAPRPLVSTTAKTSSPEAETAPSVHETPPTFFSFLDRLLQQDSKRRSSIPPEATGHTAVYDIQARTLYLPTGEILEAHSGLGDVMDDIRYVHEKGRGPTPPNVYLLSLREHLFHGVQAIRLTPIGKANMFGRAGILAHPYMLGPTGQSNGCVSVENYPKFLEAYLHGDVERLVVIPRRSDQPSAEVSARLQPGSEDRFRPI